MVLALAGIPGEEKWELLNEVVAVPVFAPVKVRVTFKLFVVKSNVFVVLKLWTWNSRLNFSLKQYLTSDPSAGTVT